VSQENVDIVEHLLRMFSDQDIDGMMDAIDSEVEIDYSESDALDAAVYRGHTACRGFLQGRYEDWENRRFEPMEILDAPPNAVVALGRMRGKGRASGVDVEANSVTVWTLRHGNVSQIKLYRTRAEALKAVGLKE
jgi:ketosteroid isomerase-like protein